MKKESTVRYYICSHCPIVCMFKHEAGRRYYYIGARDTGIYNSLWTDQIEPCEEFPLERISYADAMLEML